MEGANTKSALLFIPDISGFTQFISDREIRHNHRIVAELLEILIESNHLNLKVNEIEGDAILFYRLGEPPAISELVEQSKRMYLAFHRHLKKYGISRICNCAACNRAARLTLKTVAHYGSLTIQKIQNREKLFGPDVIKIHRLLKNDIPGHEYILITESIPGIYSAIEDPVIGLKWDKGAGRYDVGEINYAYASLQPFYAEIPEVKLPVVKMYKSKLPLVYTIGINSPINIVYEALTDLDQRIKWMSGLKKIKIENESLNRMNKICTSFECEMHHETCTFQTSSVKFSDHRASFSETLLQHPITFYYDVEELSNKTNVKLECHDGFGLPMKWIFNFFLRKKFNADNLQSLSQLKNYCEEKVKDIAT
jgi:hypothetical protein